MCCRPDDGCGTVTTKPDESARQEKKRNSIYLKLESIDMSKPEPADTKFDVNTTELNTTILISSFRNDPAPMIP